jgi:hypothetical protein
MGVRELHLQFLAVALLMQVAVEVVAHKLELDREALAVLVGAAQDLVHLQQVLEQQVLPIQAAVAVVVLMEHRRALAAQAALASSLSKLTNKTYD